MTQTQALTAYDRTNKIFWEMKVGPVSLLDNVTTSQTLLQTQKSQNIYFCRTGISNLIEIELMMC